MGLTKKRGIYFGYIPLSINNMFTIVTNLTKNGIIKKWGIYIYNHIYIYIKKNIHIISPVVCGRNCAQRPGPC
jgi:NDP-sugar pyrophosphorylase family protein